MTCRLPGCSAGVPDTQAPASQTCLLSSSGCFSGNRMPTSYNPSACRMPARLAVLMAALPCPCLARWLRSRMQHGAVAPRACQQRAAWLLCAAGRDRGHNQHRAIQLPLQRDVPGISEGGQWVWLIAYHCVQPDVCSQWLHNVRLCVGSSACIHCGAAVTQTADCMLQAASRHSFCGRLQAAPALCHHDVLQAPVSHRTSWCSWS